MRFYRRKVWKTENSCDCSFHLSFTCKNDPWIPIALKSRYWNFNNVTRVVNIPYKAILLFFTIFGNFMICNWTPWSALEFFLRSGGYTKWVQYSLLTVIIMRYLHFWEEISFCLVLWSSAFSFSHTNIFFCRINIELFFVHNVNGMLTRMCMGGVCNLLCWVFGLCLIRRKEEN